VVIGGWGAIVGSVYVSSCTSYALCAVRI